MNQVNQNPNELDDIIGVETLKKQHAAVTVNSPDELSSAILELIERLKNNEFIHEE